MVNKQNILFSVDYTIIYPCKSSQANYKTGNELTQSNSTPLFDNSIGLLMRLTKHISQYNSLF